MEKVLIVDGHSAIFSTPWLRELHNTNTDAGRDALIRELNDYQNLSDTYVVLVYDGKGKRIDREGGTEKEILILYSKTNQTADTIIERLAAKQSKKHQVQVASNDRMVLESCYASGALAMSIDSLWDLVDYDLGNRNGHHRL